ACRNLLEDLESPTFARYVLAAGEIGDEHANPMPRPQRIGRFEIVAELGRGGFGIVYRARDPELGRDVALKVPRIEVLLSDEALNRFDAESRAAAKLDHPNIVPLYEIGQDGLFGFIVYAFCPGPTLAQWRKDRNEPVPPGQAAELVATLADAVQHAHDR